MSGTVEFQVSSKRRSAATFSPTKIPLLSFIGFFDMQKLIKIFRPKGNGKGNTDQSSSSTAKQPRSPQPVAEPRPSPPHELPAFNFAPPLSQLDLSKNERETGQLETTESPQLAGQSPSSLNRLSPPLPPLQTTTTPSSFVIPPTPIEPSPLSHSISRSSSPPPIESTSPVASTSSPPPVRSASTTSTHLIPPSSPNLSLSPRSRSPARRGHHRRSSSTGSRSFRETLNAYAVEDANGQRCVNQYVIGQTQGPLGRGTYAVVEKAVDRETNTEYVSLIPVQVVDFLRAHNDIFP